MGSVISGKHSPNSGIVLAAAVLDAQDPAARFKAMKQLLDIGVKRIKHPDALIEPREFTFASKGAVCALPACERPGDTLKVLYSKDAAVQAVPASVTKVMALVTGIGFLSSLDETVRITAADIRHGSGDVFQDGDLVKIRDLMLAMMLPSSNTAAQAYSRVCGEKILRREGVSEPTSERCDERFITEMNRKAAAIGMRQSAFVTPSGLKIGNYTAADDLLRLIIEAQSDWEIKRIWGEKTCAISIDGSSPRTIRINTTVKDTGIESSYYILGGKTGTFSGGTSSVSAEALIMVARKFTALDSVKYRVKRYARRLMRAFKKALRKVGKILRH